MAIQTSSLHASCRWCKRLLALALTLFAVGAVGIGNAYADKGNAPHASKAAHIANTADNSAALSSCQAQAANPPDRSRCSAKVGDLPTVALAELHPTQAALGYDEVFYRLGRYHTAISKDRINQRFNDWCQANGQGDAASAQPDASLQNPESFTCKLPLGQETRASLADMKTAVVGPSGKLYLTDGHHTMTAFYESEGAQVRVRVRIVDNFSYLSEAEFWRTMQRQQWLWLRDANDQPITPEQLPQGMALKQFGDDPYRSVMYFVRGIGYDKSADSPPFQEFYWGRWLRAQPTIGQMDACRGIDMQACLALIERVAQAQVALADTAEVSDNKTAADLGRLHAWNKGRDADSGAFGKLRRPYTAAKPGKLAYLMQYRQSLATGLP